MTTRSYLISWMRDTRREGIAMELSDFLLSRRRGATRRDGFFCWCFNMWLRLSTACVYVYVTWWVSLLRQHLLPGLIVQQVRPQSRLPLKHHDQHERAEDRNDTHNSSYCTDGWGITLYTHTEGGTSTSIACWRNLTFVQHCIYLYFSVCADLFDLQPVAPDSL